MKKNALALFLLALFVLSGCKKTPQPAQMLKAIKINPGYTEYVSAFTSGSISAVAPIIIQFSKAIDSAKMSKDPKSDWFHFTPSISGKASWLNAYAIQFKPNKSLNSGQVYYGSFDLNQVFDTPKELKSFPLGFATIRQDIYLSNTHLVTPSNDDYSSFAVEGSLTTEDQMDKDMVEKVLTISVDGVSQKLNWTHDASGKTHRFLSKQLLRTDKEQQVKVSLDGSTANVDQKRDLNFIIPQKNAFTYLHSQLQLTPTQQLTLFFSDHLSQTMSNLAKSIQLGAGDAIQVQVMGNKLIINPKNKLKGSKLLTIKHGILQNANDIALDQDLSESFVFSSEKPQVKFIGKGTLLPSSDNGLTIPFQAISLKAVDVRIIKIFQNNIGQFLQSNSMDQQYGLTNVARTILIQKIPLNLKEGESADWKTFSLDLSKLIAIDPGAIYRVELSFRKDYYDYDCSGIPDNTKQRFPSIDDYNQEADQQSSAWDYAESYYNDDSYTTYEDRSDPTKNAYYNPSQWASKNILASNLGIIAKRGASRDFDVYITDLRTTDPIDGVLVEAYNYQQQKIAAGKTESGGHVKLNCQNGKAFYIIASRANEKNYLKVSDQNSLSLSMFDIGGSSVQKGLKGFIYGDRGVWRPGDTLHVGFILEDKNHTLPVGHPITFELTDPAGVLVKSIISNTTPSNIYTFPVSTDLNAPTGTYNITIGVGGVNFYQTAKIETVKPNRLKIKLDFPVKKLTSTMGSMKGSLDVKWLNGATAKDLEAKIKVSLLSIPTQFASYGNYTFNDPSRKYEPAEASTLFDEKIDKNGHADVPLDIDRSEVDPPGMLEARITTRVFERGGDFSIHQMTIPYAPYEYFVGLNAPKGDDRGMILTDEDHDANIITVDPDGNPLGGKRVSVTLYKVEWRWWWDVSAKTGGLFTNSDYTKEIVSQDLVTDDKGQAKFTFQVKYPEWGRYFLVVKGANGHTAGKVIYIDWPGWAKRVSKDGGAGATMLMFTSDKPKYKVGDKATITIPSAEGGRALVSIENSSKVISAFWLQTTKDQTVATFDITSEMTPNMYVNVELLQAHAQTKNNLPIRMYGIIPIQVEDSETILKPQIITADEYRSAKEINVKVKEASGRPMYYTLAIVDEGLLDLTNFITPNPWNKFYVRESLGVRTWDVYDQVIGAYGGQIESLFSIGGGGEGTDGKQKEVSRFKPVVKYLGPFELKSGATNEHKVTLPAYVGSVRVMVVAEDGKGAYGNAEKAVPVRDPLMILSTMPRVLGPNEVIKLPVTVFCMSDKIKSVQVKVEYLSLLKGIGVAEKTIAFTELGDQDVVFDAKSLAQLGVAKIKVTATGGGETATQTIELNVRTSNPVVAKSQSWLLKSNETLTQNLQVLGIDGTNTQTLEFSTIPPINMTKRLSYLIQYPHGCIEQTTSSVFPQLFIPSVVEISPELKTQISKNIKAGIQRISSFQTASGGFSYWPSEGTANDWGTSYAGNFLLEAEKLGYNVPNSMKSAWLKYQRNEAINCSVDAHTAYSQGYRLYTLALSGNAELGAMNRLRDYLKVHSDNKVACWQLASAYVMAGQKEVAQDLLDVTNMAIDSTQARELSGNYGSYWRDEAKLLELLVQIDRPSEAFALAQSISEQLNTEDWMNTQETANCLMSMCLYANTTAKGNKVNVGVKVNYTTSNTKDEQQITSQYNDKVMDLKPENGNFTVTNTGSTPVYVVLGTTGSPLRGTEGSDHNKISMKVEYVDMDGKSINVKNLPQGTDFKARVTVLNLTYNRLLSNLALTQIFPAGWEITNTRLYTGVAGTGAVDYDYRDIRDDRVMTYFRLGTQGRAMSGTFEVYLTAAYVGTYYLPAVQCDAMYDNTIFATEKGMEVSVTK